MSVSHNKNFLDPFSTRLWQITPFYSLSHLRITSKPSTTWTPDFDHLERKYSFWFGVKCNDRLVSCQADTDFEQAKWPMAEPIFSCNFCRLVNYICNYNSISQLWFDDLRPALNRFSVFIYTGRGSSLVISICSCRHSVRFYRQFGHNGSAVLKCIWYMKTNTPLFLSCIMYHVSCIMSKSQIRLCPHHSVIKNSISKE
jgi:hypothetical protein